MIKFVVTLRSGGDFEAWDVITLANQVRQHLLVPHQFCCVTDTPIDNDAVEEIPLTHDWPGWWAMVEMFKVTGPVIASGLDMIVIDNIDRLAELAVSCPDDTFYMARPQPPAFRKGEKWCSGLQIWNGDWSWLCDNFNPDIHINQFEKEQRYTAYELHNDGADIRAVQDHFDGYRSYKNDCRGGPPIGTKLVLFHGHPRPNNCKEKWVRDIYNNPYIYEHPFETIKEEVENETGDSQ